MSKRFVGWALLVILGQGLAGCGHGNPTAPTSAVTPAPSVNPTPVRPVNYDVVFVADAACTDLPAVVRTRTYAGALDGHFLHLSGSDVGADWNVMYLYLEGDSARVYASDPPIWERPTSDTDLMIEGNAKGTVSSDGSQISFAFPGTFMYCPAVDRAESRYSKCEVPRIRCESKNHQLTLSRK